MKAAERDELLIELRTALLGVKESEDNGMVGDMSEIKDQVRKINGENAINTTYRKITLRVGLPILIALVVSAIIG